MNGTCACITVFCLAASAVMGDSVTRRYADIDGDGMPEVSLENKFIKVVFMTGQPAAKPPVILKKNGLPRLYKYGKRFCWGGWLYSYEFKPTGRSWLAHLPDSDINWQGIPDEFEEAVRMAEVEPGRYACMIPGIGTAVGTGRCYRESLNDIAYAPWHFSEECLVNGAWRPAAESDSMAEAWRLVFRQRIETTYGYGCEYVKTVTMRAGSSQLQMDRTLENTGTQDFHTTFFTHGFWGQGKDEAFDRDCWSTIPTRALPVKGSPYPADLLDTVSCMAVECKPAYYWGPVTREELGGNWHACGNRNSGDVFMTAIGRQVDFFRIWTDSKTYACEPFIEIDLKPGEVFAWKDTRGTGNGLTAVKAQGDGGMMDWRMDESASAIVFSVLPYREGNGKIRIEGTIGNGKQTLPVAVESAVVSYSPAAPVSVMMPLTETYSATIMQLKLNVAFMDADGRESSQGITVSQSWKVNENSWKGVDAGQAQAIVIGDITHDSKGNWRLNGSVKFWEEYLREAGFVVQLVDWQEASGTADWDKAKLAVVSCSRLGAVTLRRAENFARNGGGIIFHGPIDYRSFELSDLLPITGVQGEINLRTNSPLDGTREFECINEERYHLMAATENGITAELPWYPRSYQGVAQFQLVRPRPEATVALSLVPGRQLPAHAEPLPGVLTMDYGRGRVALMTMPLMWGGPANCVIWGRLGEYHRQFAVQLAGWAMGK